MARNYKVKMELEVDSKSMNKLKQLFKDMDMKWNRDTLKEAKTMSDQMRELNKTLAKLRVDLSKIKSFGGSSKGDERNLGDLLKEVKVLNDNTMKNHNQIVSKYFKVWTDAKGGMKQGKDLSEEGKTERAYIRQQIKSSEVDAAYAKYKWHIQAKVEDMKILKMDHQLKQQRMYNRSFLSVMGSGGSFFESVKALLKTTDTFSPYGDMLRLAHLDPTTKAQITAARTSKDPMSRSSAISMASTEGINLENAIKAQNTFFGQFLKKLDKLAPDIQTPRGMAMAGLGIAGVALLTKAFRKALDSSPMLKQMAKLLDFGIMMVLRPIGDFFGFLFRPILILLLRKFIIPFYQEYMPLMRKLGQDLGNFLAKVIDTATDPLAAAGLVGAGVAGGIFTYFKKKGGNIQIFSKNAISQLGKISQPSLWRKISNAITIKAPHMSLWRKISNALTIKAPNIKFPSISLKIPKVLQPLLDVLGNVKITPPPSTVARGTDTGADLLKFIPKFKSLGFIGALFEPFRVGLSGIMDTWKRGDPEGWMAFQMATGGLDPDSAGGIFKQVTGLGGFGFGRTQEEIERTAGGHKIDGQDIRFNKRGDTPSSSIAGDWGMGGVPSPTIIIQADTITTEAIDNVTDKMANVKRTFNSLG